MTQNEFNVVLEQQYLPLFIVILMPHVNLLPLVQ